MEMSYRKNRNEGLETSMKIVKKYKILQVSCPFPRNPYLRSYIRSIFNLPEQKKLRTYPFYPKNTKIGLG
jgi:hypothetical protein